MLSYQQQRALTILVVTGIIITIILTIVILISIWMPSNNDNIEDSFKVGKASYISVEQEDVVKKYFSEVFSMLLSKDYKTLYDKLSPDYIKHNEMTEIKLKEFLENENIVGQPLELYKYDSGKLPGYNNIYSINMKVADNVYDIKLIIKESSPKQYTISFDEFVDLKENIYSQTNESINFTVNKVIYFNSKVQYDVTIKNVYKDNIILNSKQAYESIMLKDKSENLIAPSVVVLGGKSLKLIPNETRKLKLVYNVGSLNYKNISGIIMKDVLYSNLDRNTDINFNIY